MAEYPNLFVKKIKSLKLIRTIFLNLFASGTSLNQENIPAEIYEKYRFQTNQSDQINLYQTLENKLWIDAVPHIIPENSNNYTVAEPIKNDVRFNLNYYSGVDLNINPNSKASNHENFYSGTKGHIFIEFTDTIKDLPKWMATGPDRVYYLFMKKLLAYLTQYSMLSLESASHMIIYTSPFQTNLT
ncbi:MAG: hypothetical protein MHPSP_000835 [Paramarteilia canceri]